MNPDFLAEAMVWIGLVVATFLIGGIPFGLLAGKCKGIDLRNVGSGNIGATNAFRMLGKGWGIAVFLLDFAKGYVPLLLVSVWLKDTVSPLDVVMVLCGMGAVLGHNFSPYLGFKGGKGMATSAGILLAWIPLALLLCVAVWGLVFLVTRYVSLASIIAGLALPVITVVTVPDRLAYIAAAILLGLMSVWKHRTNIRRLRDGTEHRFVRRKAEPTHDES